MALKKELGFLDIFCISSGAMISSGLFVLPGILFALVGPGVWMSVPGCGWAIFLRPSC